MISWSSGDLFQSPALALVNPVNCRGVMGAGLAAQFRDRASDAYPAYQEACRAQTLRPGGLTWAWSERFPGKRAIVHLATKDHWKDPSRLEWVAAGVGVLRDLFVAEDWDSAAIPQLGCGLGGLHWSDVRPLMEEAFGEIRTACMIYGPGA